MNINDKVVVLSGPFTGRQGTVIALDDVFGIGVHLGHVDKHCFHLFERGELEPV